MRKTTFGLLALLISAAPSAAEDATPESDQPDQCDALYVPGAEKLQPVYLSVHIDAAGNISHGVVVRSSGDPAVDKASLDCLTYHHLKDTSLNDGPVEFNWIIQLRWSSKPHGYVVLPNPDTGQFNNCVAELPRIPTRLIEDGFQGEAKVKFRLTTDGTVTDPILTKSSGNQELDNLSLSCAKAYKYFPAFQGQKRIEVDRTVTVRWIFGDATLPPSPELLRALDRAK